MWTYTIQRNLTEVQSLPLRPNTPATPMCATFAGIYATTSALTIGGSGHSPGVSAKQLAGHEAGEIYLKGSSPSR